MGASVLIREPWYKATLSDRTKHEWFDVVPNFIWPITPDRCFTHEFASTPGSNRQHGDQIRVRWIARIDRVNAAVRERLDHERERNTP